MHETLVVQPYLLVLLLFLGVMQGQLFVQNLFVSLRKDPWFGPCVGHSSPSSVLKVVYEGLITLQTCVGDLADLDAHEIGPFVLVKFLVEVLELGGTGHVDEGVAHVAPVGGVHRQLEEVVAPQKVFVDQVQQHGLRVFVGDVLDHQGGALVRGVADLVAGHVVELFLVLLFQRVNLFLLRAAAVELVLGGHDVGRVLAGEHRVGVARHVAVAHVDVGRYQVVLGLMLRGVHVAW